MREAGLELSLKIKQGGFEEEDGRGVLLASSQTHTAVWELGKNLGLGRLAE